MEQTQEETVEELRRKCELLTQQLGQSNDEAKRERSSADQLRRALEQERLRSSQLERELKNVDESHVDPTDQKGKGYVHTFSLQDPTFMADVESVEAKLGLNPTVDQQLRALGIEAPAQLAASAQDAERIADAVSLPNGAQTALVACYHVVDCLVEGIKNDPNIRYYCGRDTEIFRLLTIAMAARFAWLLGDEEKTPDEIGESLWAQACEKPADIERFSTDPEHFVELRTPSGARGAEEPDKE